MDRKKLKRIFCKQINKFVFKSWRSEKYAPKNYLKIAYTVITTFFSALLEKKNRTGIELTL
jgi:hypothetical protein